MTGSHVSLINGGRMSMHNASILRTLHYAACGHVVNEARSKMRLADDASLQAANAAWGAWTAYMIAALAAIDSYAAENGVALDPSASAEWVEAVEALDGVYSVDVASWRDPEMREAYLQVRVVRPSMGRDENVVYFSRPASGGAWEIDD